MSETKEGIIQECLKDLKNIDIDVLNYQSTILIKLLEQKNLFICFGQSDDLFEFRGKIFDELGAYGGSEAYLTGYGDLLQECESTCIHYQKALKGAKLIQLIWNEGKEYAWEIKTKIKHHKFMIYEDGEAYSEAILIDLDDIEENK